MHVELSATEKRLVIASLVLSGVVHLLVPERLLGVARRGYGLGLDVEFEPRSKAPRRIRLVGLASLFVAAVAHRFA